MKKFEGKTNVTDVARWKPHYMIKTRYLSHYFHQSSVIHADLTICEERRSVCHVDNLLFPSNFGNVCDLEHLGLGQLLISSVIANRLFRVYYLDSLLS